MDTKLSLEDARRMLGRNAEAYSDEVLTAILDSLSEVAEEYLKKVPNKLYNKDNKKT